MKIFVSGGLDEAEIISLRDSVDGFGVGTSISTSPVIDFGGKIVAVEDENTGKTILRSKRGDLSGIKNVYRDYATLTDVITLDNEPPSSKYRPLLQPLLRDGKIVRDFMALDDLRKRTIETVSQVSKTTPRMLVG